MITSRPTVATPSVRVRVSEKVNLILISLSIPKSPLFALPSPGLMDSTLEIVGITVSIVSLSEPTFITVLFPAMSTTSAFRLIVLLSSYSAWASTCASVIEASMIPLAILFDGSTATGSPSW